MNNLSITQRLSLIVGLLLLTIAGIVALESLSFRESMLQERREKIHEMTDSAIAMVKNYDAQVSAGKISLAEAQAAARLAIKGMRWGAGDYFTINRFDGMTLVHGRPEYENVNRMDSTDPSGVRTVEVSVRLAKSGGGYFYLISPRAGETVPMPKVLYVGGYVPWQWAISAGVYLDDVDAAVWRRLAWVAGLAALAAVAAAGLAVYVARSISRPIGALCGTMKSLAGGDTAVAVPFIAWRHETGEIARAVDVFRQNMIRADQISLEQRAEQETKTKRQVAIEGHIAAFEGGVRGSLDTLASAATELRATSQSMSATAEETRAQGTTVASAAEQATANVQTVAAATEELSTSVVEIARQVDQSTKIAGQAVDEAGRTNTIVQGLSEAAQKIGAVVKLISDIANQTNLLALNATIEAARAGEAGRGFAIVASEVKSLANETAKATEEIAAQVAAMRDATSGAVQAIEVITGTIGTINKIATTIATAVEEQGTATREIARNIDEAAQGTGQVSSSILEVNQAATETGLAATRVLTSADQLATQAETLRSDVDSFLANIRAA
jgi:methyl-accepting chemotaxis protein